MKKDIIEDNLTVYLYKNYYQEIKPINEKQLKSIIPGYWVKIAPKEYIESKWSKQWGDRMNELVFIGQDIDKEKMIADLEKCLLQDNELYLFDQKAKLAVPFPKDI